MHAHARAHTYIEYRYLQRLEEGVDYPEAVVTGSCELSSKDAGY